MRAVKDLVSAVRPMNRESIAVVGGGGKTTLMFTLAEELRLTGRRIITSTTTKIWQREAICAPEVVFCGSSPRWRARLEEKLERLGHVFVGRGLLETGKVEGVDPRVVDALFGDRVADHIVLEADGSAGRPVKVPASHEPVVPESTTTAVALMGLEALGRPLGPDLVFRMERFELLTGLAAGQCLTPLVLAGIFRDPNGLFKGVPSSARRIVFLNKADLAPDKEKLMELSNLLLASQDCRFERIVVGSLMKKEYTIIKG